MNKTDQPFNNTPSPMPIWNSWYCSILTWMGFRTTSRLRSFLREAASIESPENDAAMISYWAAESVVEPNNPISELVVPRNRFIRRMFSDRFKRSVWEGFVVRAQAMNSAHVIDHFTSVTGHSIQDVTLHVAEELATEKEANRPLRSAPTSKVSAEAKKSLGLASFAARPTKARSEKADQHAKKRDRAATPLQTLGKRTLVSTLGIYLMLVVIGSWEPATDYSSTSKLLPVYSWLELGSHPRGRTIPPDMYISRRYKKAVRTLQRANTSVFGYLPGMGKDLLNEGIIELESAIAFQQRGGYIYPQALMLLADAYIRAGQPSKAVPLIDYVISRDERKAPEARQLRESLRLRGLYN